jgi:hypothetical protein
LVRFRIQPEESSSEFEFSVAPDAFATALAAADRRLSGRIAAAGNAYDPAHAYSSFLRVLLDDSTIPLICSYWQLDEELVSRAARGAGALRALLKHGLLHPIDDNWAKSDDAEKREKPKNKFEIPKADAGDSDDWMSKIKSLASGGMMCLADEGLPPDSWAASLFRNAAYISAGKSKYVADDLKRLWNARDVGPLGCLSAAEALKYVNPAASQAFASRGLSTLSAESFAADVAPFLAADADTTKFLTHLATVLRELSEQEVKDLGELILGDHGIAIENIARRLRENRQRPVAEMLPFVLEAAWNGGLKSVVENRLKELASEDVAAKPAQPEQPKRE